MYVRYISAVTDSELDRMLQAERRAEAQRAIACRAEAARCAGVAWSGLSPDRFSPRSPAVLACDAENRLQEVRRWRSSRAGRLMAAMAEAERAVEAVRACVSRGLDGEVSRCRQALEALTTAAQAGMDAAR
jgi:hypothetical protein